MTPVLSWLLVAVVLGAIVLAAIWPRLDEDGAPPDDLIRGWRPLEEEATRVRTIRHPYDRTKEDDPI